MAEREIVKVTRRELYDQIWSTPMTHVSKSYGLSDVGLAKLCEDLRIPRPPRGYWAKKRSRKPTRRKRLRPLENPDWEVIEFYKYPDTPVAPMNADVERLVADLKRVENRIVVAATLSDPHPLVTRTLDSLRNQKPDAEGRVRPKARQCLDVQVCPANIDRALRILDAAIKALEAHGLPVAVDGGTTEVTVRGEQIGFQLYEELERRERAPTDDERKWDMLFNSNRKFYEKVASGRFVLRITEGQGLRRCWTDRKDRRVEGFLNSFVAGVVRVSQTIKVERVEAEARRQAREEDLRRRHEEEQRRLEVERKRREEEARFQRLMSDAAAWAKAEELRKYVAAVRAKVNNDFGDLPLDGSLAQWLEWAENRADAIDPLSNGCAVLAPFDVQK